MRALALAAATGAFLVSASGAAHAAEIVPDPSARTTSAVSTIGGVTDTVGGAVDTVDDTVGGAVDTVDDTVSGTVDTVDDTVGGAVDEVTDTVNDVTNPGSHDPVPAPAPDPPAPGEPPTGGGGHGSGGGSASGPHAPSDVPGSAQLAATGGDGSSIDAAGSDLDTSPPTVSIRTPVVPADPADPGGFGFDTAQGRFAIGLIVAAIAVLVLFHGTALWLRMANEGPEGPFPPSGSRYR